MANTSPIGFSIERNVASASISLVSPVIGATIRYTTDGSEPSAENGNIYTGSFELVGTKTVKAIVTKEGLADSAIARLEITVIVPDIVLEREDGTAVDNCKVIIVNMDAYETFAGIVFRYTTDGSEPTETSPVMNGEIEVTANCTIKVKGFSEDFGDVDTASIAIDDLKVQNPLVTNESDEYVLMEGRLNSQNYARFIFGNGKFLGVFTDNDIVRYSDDGINWSDLSILDGVRLDNENFAIPIYVNEVFMLFSNKNRVIHVSKDLSSYEIYQTNVTFRDAYFIYYCNGKFVANYYSTSGAYISEDGFNFEYIYGANVLYRNYGINKWVYGNGKIVVVSYNTSNGNHELVVTDYENINLERIDGMIADDVIFVNNKFVAIDNRNGKIHQSNDGIIWNTIVVDELKGNSRICNLLYINDKFVVINSVGCFVSDDAINWEKIASVDFETTACLFIYHDNRFLFTNDLAPVSNTYVRYTGKIDI